MSHYTVVVAKDEIRQANPAPLALHWVNHTWWAGCLWPDEGE